MIKIKYVSDTGALKDTKGELELSGKEDSHEWISNIRASRKIKKIWIQL